MQVLCHTSANSNDILCPICGKGFKLYWERSCPEERRATRLEVLAALREHHADALDASAPHPDSPFNIPTWDGPAHFSGAALLGGLPISRAVAPAA